MILNLPKLKNIILQEEVLFVEFRNISPMNSNVSNKHNTAIISTLSSISLVCSSIDWENIKQKLREYNNSVLENVSVIGEDFFIDPFLPHKTLVIFCEGNKEHIKNDIEINITTNAEDKRAISGEITMATLDMGGSIKAYKNTNNNSIFYIDNSYPNNKIIYSLYKTLYAIQKVCEAYKIDYKISN